MPDAFVPLNLALRPACEMPAASGDEPEPSPAVFPAESQIEDALASARLFRAALADALALSLERLVRDIACDVLARELRLAPADVGAIAARALGRYLDDCPLRVRVHPDDLDACHGLDISVVADDGVRNGDVVLDVLCGSIDASLGVRLGAILR